MWQGLSTQRLLLYGLFLGALPILFVVLNFASKMDLEWEFEQKMQEAKELAQIKEKKQQAGLTLRKQYQDVDHFYINKHIETLTFLQPEIESLQKILDHTSFLLDDRIKKRYTYLSGRDNCLRFSQSGVVPCGFFQETLETSQAPVEVNMDDVKNILAKIEGKTIGPYAPALDRPLLLITDFKLEKRKTQNDGEIYTLNMKLLNREFVK